MNSSGTCSWVILLLLTAGLSFGQSVNGVNLSADIPFSFTVERAILPPGHYTVRSLGAADNKTLLIESSDKHWMKSVRTHGVYALSGPLACRLRFTSYGEKHFLSEVWMPGSQSGYQLSKTPEAKEMERARRADTVVIQADRRP